MSPLTTREEPDLADDQNEKRMRSLMIANEIRGRRKEAREQMTTQTAIELLEEPAPWAAGWKVAQVIEAVPSIGITKRRRILNRCGVSESVGLGALTPRQRDALIDALQARVRSRRTSRMETAGSAQLG